MLPLPRLQQDAQQPATDFVDFDELTAPAPPPDVALDLFHLSRGGTACLEESLERLLRVHHDPVGNKGFAIGGEAVDAPVAALHEVDEDAHR